MAYPLPIRAAVMVATLRSLSRRYITATSWAFAVRIVFGVASAVSRQGLSVLMLLLATRYFSPDTFGEYAVAWAITTIIFTLVHTGIHEFILRSEEPAVIDTCFWLNTGIGVAGAVLIGAFALLLRSTTGLHGAASLLLVFSPISILTGSVAWAGALLLRNGRTNAYNLILAAGEVISFAATVVLLEYGGGIVSLAIWRLIGSIVTAICMLRVAGRRPALTFDRAIAHRALVGSLSLYGGRGVQMLTAYGSDLLLAHFISPASAAIFRVGSRVANGVGDIICMPLMTIAWARISNDHRAGRGAKVAFLQLSRYLTLVAWPVLGSLAICSDLAVRVVLGPEWQSAAPVIALAAISKMLLALDVVLEPALICTGRSRQQLSIRLTHSLILMVLLAVVCRLGPEAAAAAHLAAAIVLVGLSLSALTSALDLRAKEIIVSLAGGWAALLLCVLGSVGGKSLAAYWGAAGLAQGIAATGAALLVWMVVLAAILLNQRKPIAADA